MNAYRWLLGWTRVDVYVPTTRDRSTPLSADEAEKAVKETARFLSQLFGGATTISGKGMWLSQDGSLITEPVTIVYSYARGLTRGQRKAVLSYAKQLRDDLGQEAVMIEFNGKPRFI